MKRYELISLTLKDNKTNEIKEVLYDELDIINLFNKLDTKWQKLKEWLAKMQSKYGENATIRLKSMEKQMHIIELEREDE